MHYTDKRHLPEDQRGDSVPLPAPAAGLLVGPGGQVASTLAVTFEKQKRMLIDRTRGRVTHAELTFVVCGGDTVCWIMAVPSPVPGGASLHVWGMYTPSGEELMGRGTRAYCESKATEFAQTVVLNNIQNKIV